MSMYAQSYSLTIRFHVYSAIMQGLQQIVTKCMTSYIYMYTNVYNTFSARHYHHIYYVCFRCEQASVLSEPYNSSAGEGKQMLIEGSKTRTAFMDGYFEKKFDRIMEVRIDRKRDRIMEVRMQSQLIEPVCNIWRLLTASTPPTLVFMKGVLLISSHLTFNVPSAFKIYRLQSQNKRKSSSYN